MSGRVYHAFKVSVCGNQRRWGYVENLTREECIDESRFPSGKHAEEDGNRFFWSYALMPNHAARLTVASLGKPSRPLPGAGTTILNRMLQQRASRRSKSV